MPAIVRTDQRGFTLVEVLVAMAILLVGVLGTVTLVDGANAGTDSAASRVGAANLAREITEAAHSLDYDSLTPTGVVPALRQRPTLAGTLSGSTWTITRRGVSYTAQVTACSFDDPRDGVAASSSPAQNACSNNPTSSSWTTSPDSNPDDFRRVDVTIDWYSQGHRSHTLKQSALIVNPSGGLGPRITSMTPATVVVQDPPIASCSSPCVSISAGSNPQFNVTTSPAAWSLHWNADDGTSSGDLGGGPTFLSGWSWTWNLGSPGSGVLDGTYTVSAQAFDDRSVPGDLRASTVIVNRSQPLAPGGFVGGWDTRLGSPSNEIVDFLWARNPERDIAGYRVYRDVDKDPATTSDDQLVCPSSSSQPPITTTYCYDPTPTPTSASDMNPRYYVVAVDLSDATNPSTLRDGDKSWLTVSDIADRPTFTGGTLSSSVQDGLPTISWSDAATPRTGGSILFYRIYRDPAGSPPSFSDRYDFTSGPTNTYSDPNPGSTLNHVYWVTAVDDKLNESDAVGPFPAIP